MSNPLQSLTNATQGAVRGMVGWAFNGQREGNCGAKTDPVFQRRSMDELRRAAFASDFEVLFTMMDEFPFVTPDQTVEEAIGKISDNMFPTGTKFTHDNDAVNELLTDIIDRSRIQLRLETIVEEAAIMGYCAIRTVWHTELDRWLYEVKKREYITLETYDGVPDEYSGLVMVWPTRKEKKGYRVIQYWKKERWTKDIYQYWPEKAESLGKMPEFKDEDATTEANDYGEIPYTLVPHYHDETEIGCGVISDKVVLSVKALIRLYHKRHYAHQKGMDPSVVRTNHIDPTEPLRMGIGKVVDIRSNDPNAPASLGYLEHPGMPESAKEEMADHIAKIYRAAGMKPPPPENGLDRAGTEVSGIAVRLIDKDDAKNIETLRDNGYSNVLRSFEKMLRMGARMGLKGYEAINPDDETTWNVKASYPDFFPPTDEEIATKLSNMSAAKLPPKIKAPRIAPLFGIEDEDEVQELQAAQQKEEDRLEREIEGGFNNGNTFE